MGARNEAKIYRCPGTLIRDPSVALTGTFPFGGTILGTFDKVVCVPLPRSAPIRAEEYGGEETERVRLGRDWQIWGVARQWDLDVLQSYSLNTAPGVSGEGTFDEPETTAGALVTDHRLTLVWVPDDPAAKGFYAFRACPDPDERARFPFALVDELAPLITFRAYRGSGGVALRFGRLTDMGL